MEKTLILDSEAINALARASQRPALAVRARAILQIAFDSRALVRVPAPVLAEVCRGKPSDAAVNHLLNGRGIVAVELTPALAQHAGALLAQRRLGSAHAVDAFVVATAAHYRPSIIATSDPDDLRRLSASLEGVDVFPL